MDFNNHQSEGLNLSGSGVFPLEKNWADDLNGNSWEGRGQLVSDQTWESSLQDYLTVDQSLKSKSGSQLGTMESDRLLGSVGNDYLNGYGGNDRLWGGKGDDTLFGGAGDDKLYSGQGHDKLYGGSGIDSLWGNSGNDRLDGGTGKDWLSGGEGKDSLIDQDGGDRFTGGDGEDQFVIGIGDLGFTTITDFKIGSDKVKFQQLGLTYEQLKIKGDRQGTTISFGGKELVRLTGIKASKLNANSFEFGDPAIVQRLEALTKQAQAGSLSPGAVFSFTTATGETWTGTAGFSDLSTGVAVQQNDLFQIGSITKTFTATTILQLVQEKKVNLDDTLSRWLPTETKSIIPNADTITIKQLLNHTSGIANYTDAPSFLDALSANPTKQLQPEELLNFVKGADPTSAPGEQFSYSNTNYILLGLVIERATGSTFSYEIRERILDPLGMRNTFIGSQEPITGSYAHGYNDLNGNGQFDVADGEDVTNLNLSWAGSAGNIVSNAADLTRFGQALLSSELLSPATLNLMTILSDTGGFYGLGIFPSSVSGQTGWLGHNGGTFGYSSSLFSDPLTGATTVTLENSATGTFLTSVAQGYSAVVTPT
jgi:D-alanyl-D-alanine carboxypeptidase